MATAAIVNFISRHPGILLVIIGVAGEVVCEWNKKKELIERLKKLFGVVLVSGLLLEMAEAAKSDIKVSQAQLQIKQLGVQLMDTRNAVARASERAAQLTYGDTIRKEIDPRRNG